MTTKEIETMAMQGFGLPDGLSLPEQMLFLSLRALYGDYHAHRIDRQQAKTEKRSLIQQFNTAQSLYRMYSVSAQRYHAATALLHDVEKVGCDRCRHLARVLDGRE